jgi:hypothetical protein
MALLKTMDLKIPHRTDPGIWILSGGKIESKPAPNGKRKSDRFGVICDDYLADQRQKQQTTLAGEKTHIKHLKRVLKARTPLTAIGLDSLRAYQKCRHAKNTTESPLLTRP